ncbi:MAG: DUF6266 family protein [Weeksellaceae bacterium]|nr:hypothetical protein [Bacteroidota bacterium]MCG2780112.1 DUF6266 family protein [Weeksellaceae bacterium]
MVEERIYRGYRNPPILFSRKLLIPLKNSLIQSNYRTIYQKNKTTKNALKCPFLPFNGKKGKIMETFGNFCPVLKMDSLIPQLYTINQLKTNIMGKIYDSLLSGTSGRTGRIVVANMFGHEFSKIRPRKRTSAPTAKQQLIQQRMRKSALFMQSYRGYACDHYGRRVGMKSCYNLAMTNLMTNFVIDFVAGTITPQYPSISFSRGALLAAVPLNITLPTPDTLTVTWQDNSAGHPLRETDWVQILIAAKDEPLTSFVENAAQRTAGTYTANVPAQMIGKELYVWLAFRNMVGDMVSNSVYAGSII